MARPLRINPRFSEAEHARVLAAAAAAGMTATGWLHRAALAALAAAPPAPPLARATLAPDPIGALRRTTGTRFTVEQHAVIAERARDCGLSVSAYVRTLVLGGTPIARRSEVRAAIVAVNRVGGNLNQLVKLAHSGLPFSAELMRQVLRVRDEIGVLRQAFLDSLRGEPETAPEGAPEETGR